MKPDYYAEGADAYLAGKDETANPYDIETDEKAHLEWNHGWWATYEAALRMTNR